MNSGEKSHVCKSYGGALVEPTDQRSYFAEDEQWRNREKKIERKKEKLEKKTTQEENRRRRNIEKTSGKKDPTADELIEIGDDAYSKLEKKRDTGKKSIFTSDPYKSDDAYTAFNAYKWATDIDPKNAMAYRKLAEMYDLGIGTEKSENNAYDNFAKAAINGDLESGYIRGLHDMVPIAAAGDMVPIAAAGDIDTRYNLIQAVEFLENYIKDKDKDKDDDDDEKNLISIYMLGITCFTLGHIDLYGDNIYDDEDEFDARDMYNEKAFTYLNKIKDNKLLTPVMSKKVVDGLESLDSTKRLNERVKNEQPKKPQYPPPPLPPEEIIRNIKEHLQWRIKHNSSGGSSRTQKKKKRTIKRKHRKRNTRRK